MAASYLLLLLATCIILRVCSPTLLQHLPPAPAPAPSPWPLQFHSLLYINSSSSVLQIVDLWYDWPNGRNFNIIQSQLGNLLYDLEWTNGTSFYYDLQAKKCTARSFEVGILRPNWLDGATYLGVEKVDGFTCNVWSKADFITYWEDMESKRPVHWLFYTGMSTYVITFEVGAVLEDAKWQAPAYCFGGTEAEYGDEFTSLEGQKTKKALPGSLRIMMNQNEPSWRLDWRRWHHGLKAVFSFQ